MGSLRTKSSILVSVLTLVWQNLYSFYFNLNSVFLYAIFFISVALIWPQIKNKIPEVLLIGNIHY